MLKLISHFLVALVLLVASAALLTVFGNSIPKVMIVSYFVGVFHVKLQPLVLGYLEKRNS